MGLFSSQTTDLYRFTHDGRRLYGMPVFIGRGPKWYWVSDAAAPRFERRLRLQWALTFISIVVGAQFVMDGRGWLWVLLVPVLSAVALHYWLRRNLPRAVVTSSDLLPVDRRARDLAQAQAIGEPALWVLCGAAIAMASLDVVVLVASGDWWAWLGLLMFGACAVMMGRAILMVRRARHRAARSTAA